MSPETCLYRNNSGKIFLKNNQIFTPVNLAADGKYLSTQGDFIMLDIITKIILFSGCIIVPVLLSMALFSSIVNKGKKDDAEEI